MGNILNKINDQLAADEATENQQWLDQLAEQIRQTPTFGQEIIDRKWLEKNREKILRLKNVIDLIG